MKFEKCCNKNLILLFRHVWKYIFFIQTWKNRRRYVLLKTFLRNNSYIKWFYLFVVKVVVNKSIHTFDRLKNFLWNGFHRVSSITPIYYVHIYITNPMERSKIIKLCLHVNDSKIKKLITTFAKTICTFT